jgi:hypothetical protein
VTKGLTTNYATEQVMPALNLGGPITNNNKLTKPPTGQNEQNLRRMGDCWLPKNTSEKVESPGWTQEAL